MATIHVDGQEYEVEGSENLLQACLSLGLDIPYFCWHPALGSVGACRQCAVKQYANADDKRGRLVMSCMTPASDNTYIAIEDEEAKAFRKSVVEWLMTNHPHDCPVCEEGGHCHLQDMTVMTGHHTRRYRFSKRTHNNQDLGPFINHEMNRCIACYRCVRYYKDYAGGEDLGVYGAHDNVYFGRACDGTLESEFSGNLVEVCPTGVFTDKTHSARYNRKWDMQFAPSICQQCSVGCNTSPGERYGELRRIENRYNGAVNHYFLCDRGRFGYGYVNRTDRPREPLLRQGDALVAAPVDGALNAIAAAVGGARRVLGIGSPRASLEANFALRELVGEGNFFSGMEQSELVQVRRVVELLQGGVAAPSLREIERFDAVLVLGEDVTQTAPRIALALRQAAKSKARALAADKRVMEWQAEAIANIGQRDLSPVFIASSTATRLDDIAAATYRAAPEDIARLGFAVAHALDAAAPAVSDFSAELQALAQQIANALKGAKKPLVVSGTGQQSLAVIDAAANVATALKKAGADAGLSLVVPEANSIGAAVLGGGSVQEALALLASGQADALVVLENDLYRRADAAAVDQALAAAKLVVVDHQLTATGEKALAVLPAASFAEGDGTLINNEGRAQRFFQVYDPAYYNLASQIKESWRWLQGIQGSVQRRPLAWSSLDQVTAAVAAAYPLLAGVHDAAPEAGERVAGRKIARMPHRYSGRTAMRANVSVHEVRQPQDADSALTFSMEGYAGPQEPAALIPFAWAPGWNSPQAWNKFQDEVGGHLRQGDPGVRLFSGGDAACAGTVPEPFAPRADAFRAVPVHHIFGSEELSARADVMAERIPQAYLALSAVDAARIGAQAGQALTIEAGSLRCSLPLVIDEQLPAGLLAVPQGLPGVPVLSEAWVRVSAGGAA